MALTGANRLSLRFHRDRLNRDGHAISSRFFTLIICDQDIPTQSPRFAILISKKVASLATDRNRLKRLISSFIMSLLPSLSVKDYLIILKKQVLLQDSQTLKKDLDTIFS